VLYGAGRPRRSARAIGAAAKRTSSRSGTVANHKRKRPKNRRAGCLLCKRWKVKGSPSRVSTPSSFQIIAAASSPTIQCARRDEASSRNERPPNKRLKLRGAHK